MLKVYYCRRPADLSAADRLPPWRRERLAATKYELAKRSSLGAGLLWRRVMEQNGIDPLLPVTLLPAGKPVFSDGAAFFSLSHAGEYCLCALSDRPVGADVEVPRWAPISVARRFCPDEQQFLLSLPEAQQGSALLSVWVKKEAWVKAESRDKMLSLNEYSVLSAPPPWHFTDLSLPDQCHAAVCGMEDCPPAEEIIL